MKGNDPIGDTPIIHQTMIMGGRVYMFFFKTPLFEATPRNGLKYKFVRGYKNKPYLSDTLTPKIQQQFVLDPKNSTIQPTCRSGSTSRQLPPE